MLGLSVAVVLGLSSAAGGPPGPAGEGLITLVDGFFITTLSGDFIVTL